jgi:hypothetical protein
MNTVLGHFAFSEVYLINTMFLELNQFMSASFIIMNFLLFRKPKSIIINHNYRRRTKVFERTAIEAGFQIERNLKFVLHDTVSWNRLSESYVNKWILNTTETNDIRIINPNFSFFLCLQKFILKIILSWNLKK